MIGLAHERRDAQARAAATFSGAHSAIAMFKLFVRYAESNSVTSDINHFEIDFVEERASFAREVQDGRLAVVEYLMSEEGIDRGEIVQCTESMAIRLEGCGIARIITEEQAVEYGRKRRQTSGGWMDSPQWRPFVASYKRLRTAVYSRHQPRLDTTTQASKAA